MSIFVHDCFLEILVLELELELVSDLSSNARLHFSNNIQALFINMGTYLQGLFSLANDSSGDVRKLVRIKMVFFLYSCLEFVDLQLSKCTSFSKY